ncbi:hypothetical protein HZI73_00600 [Vallitalea pronyensis]|uniref:Fibronectin type-III domain-containing protein n=1 Tax=Vallitalea pronyensis TaxID=1348613 RepID=A0A8J8MFM6_9FIRM|nr:hypothetical protein [Vallitalea pronyensis]QUI20897.1 hypothetical protein HZI73_00600 [Vallitalea pronyensis]
MKVKKAIIYTFFMIFVLKINTVIILGDTIEAYKPLSNIVDISCGFHGMALKDNGTIWSWGKNTYGQLGDETTIDKNSPIQVENVSDIQAMVGGQSYSIILKNDGTLWSWGANGAEGNLGNNSLNSSLIPVQVSGLTSVQAIDSYELYSLALKNDGTVWAWGHNYSYVLGIIEPNSKVPVQVSNLSDVKAIAAGSISAVLKNDGTVWTWGGGLSDSRFPTKVNGLSDVIAIDSGGVVVALKSDGTVWAWGKNYYGQLGNGTKFDSSSPVQVMNLTDIVAISAGNSHVMALKDDGTVWTWGYNDHGQLGDGSLEERLTPVQISNLSGVKAIDAGRSVSMVLKEDGTVWAWGWNISGQIGDGTTKDKSIPIQVKALTSITSPSYPINVQVTAGVSKVNLSWDSVPEADSYNIKRSTTSGSNYTTIATDITTTTYTDIGLTNGTTYYYVVIAKNAAGESENSGEVSATPSQISPSSPTELFVENRHQSVKLTWSEVEGATAYKVKRGTVSGGPYTVMGDNITDIVYMDTGLTNEVDYYYVVSAVNAEGESADSNEVVGRPLGDTNGLFRPGAKGVAPVTNLLGANGTAEIEVASIGAIAYKSIDSTLNLTSDKYILFYNVTTAPATSVRNTPLVKLQDDSSLFQSTTENYNASTGRKVWKFETTQNIKELLWWGHTTDVNPKIKEFMLIQVDDVTYNLSDAELLAKYHYIENTVTCALSYDYVSRGKNKFDKDKVKIFDLFISSSGIETPSTDNFKTTDFIPIAGGKTYTLNTANTGTTAQHGVYDAQLNLIQLISQNTKTFTIDASGCFIRIGYRIAHDDVNIIQLEEGSNATAYEPYTSDKTEFSISRPMISIGGVSDEVKDGRLHYRSSDTYTLQAGDYKGASIGHLEIDYITYILPTDCANLGPSGAITKQVFIPTKSEGIYQSEIPASEIGKYFTYDSNGEQRICFIIAKGTGATARAEIEGLLSLNYQLAKEEVIEDGQQGFKAPYSIKAYQNGDLVQYATSIKQVKLTNTNTILMDDKCIEIVELESNGTKLSGQLGSDGKTITLDNNHTGTVYAKCKRDPSTYLNVQLVAVHTPSNVEAIAKDQAVTLSWNYIEGVDNYTIIRSTSPEDNYITIASNITSSVYNDTGLTNGTTYYYKILANKDGESGSSSVISATPQGIPSIPTGLAVENGYKSVKLTWEKSNAASTYRIKRSTTSGGPYTQIADQVTNTTYTDTNLINGTNYYYVISAVNTTGESADSNEITGQPTIVKPNTPINIDVLVGDKVVTLTWHDMINAESYIIKRSTTKGGPYTLVADQITTNTYTDANLSNATPYYYIIIAKNSVGESQPSNEIEAIAGVQRPTNVIIQKVDTGIRLSWNLVNDASSYKVKRSETLEGPYTVIQDNITGTDYTDTTIQNNKIYYYVLSAVNYLGESPDTKPISVYVQDDSKERYVLLITLINGMQREYDISADTAVEFMQWYTNRANGIGTPFFTLFNEEKEEVYGNSKDYIGFNTILYYQLNEYKIIINE